MNIRDAQQASHLGYIQAQLFMGDFMRLFLAPQLDLMQVIQAKQVLDQWDAVPPEVIAEVEKENPEGYKRAAAQIAELRKRVEKGRMNYA